MLIYNCRDMKLSDFELEIMNILWEKKQSTAPELHSVIKENRNVTYSTVKTIIDRLESKSAIRRVRQYGRTIIYAPVVSQETMQKPLLKKFIDKVFSGNPGLLVNQLLEDEQLSDEDIEYLKSIVNKK